MTDEQLYQTWDGRWLTWDKYLAHCQYTVREAEFWAAEEKREEEVRESLRVLWGQLTGWLVPVVEWLDRQLGKLSRKDRA